MKVELIYDNNCPNVGETRFQIINAFKILGKKPQWLEWERSSPDCPLYAQGFGSPTVLVNEQDILKEKPTGTNCCRLYGLEEGKPHGVPAVNIIIAAIKKAFPQCQGK